VYNVPTRRDGNKPSCSNVGNVRQALAPLWLWGSLHCARGAYRPDRKLGSINAVSHPSHRRRPIPSRNAPSISNRSSAFVLDYVGAVVADTGHVANGGSIDQGDLLDLISDAAGDVAVSRLTQALGSSDGWTPRGGRSALFQLRRSCEAVSQKQAKRLAARFDLVVCRPFVNSENDRLWKTNCHSRIMAGSRAAPAFPFSVYRY